MKNIANQIKLTRLAINLKKATSINHFLERIAKSLEALPRRNDIEENLEDNGSFNLQAKDAFQKLRNLLCLLNQAPEEIRNAPETTQLARKIVLLMSDHAD